ncbi:MAG: L-lactate permease, partial [Flavisolibacter sp.]|nr:L-lactate permease [Flavisolibacter sp.]
VLLSAFISLPLIGLSFGEGIKIFAGTINRLKFPILTVASVLGFAYVLNNSGISNTLAAVLANTGVLFPFFAPVLGWLGVFITGSDTSSNALFGKVQFATARSIGVDPVVTVAANVSGGVVGKMISPQSIAIGAASVNLIGKESQLFRFTVKHSFIMLFMICLLVTVQAYVLKGLIPSYRLIDAKAAVSNSAVWTGYLYLLILAVGLTAIAFYIMRISKREIKKVQEVSLSVTE